MTDERLSLALTVTLDGAGQGTLLAGPGKYGETWNITRITTNGNSTLDPDLRIYRGAPGGTSMLDTTARGNGDVSETSLTVQSGERIAAQYTLGTAGAIMNLFLEGDITRGV